MLSNSCIKKAAKQSWTWLDTVQFCPSFIQLVFNIYYRYSSNLCFSFKLSLNTKTPKILELGTKGPVLVLREINLLTTAGMNVNIINGDIKRVDESWTELDTVQFCPTFVQPSWLEGISYLMVNTVCISIFMRQRFPLQLESSIRAFFYLATYLSTQIYSLNVAVG